MSLIDRLDPIAQSAFFLQMLTHIESNLNGKFEITKDFLDLVKKVSALGASTLFLPEDAECRRNIYACLKKIYAVQNQILANKQGAVLYSEAQTAISYINSPRKQFDLQPRTLDQIKKDIRALKKVNSEAAVHAYALIRKHEIIAQRAQERFAQTWGSVMNSTTRFRNSFSSQNPSSPGNSSSLSSFNSFAHSSSSPWTSSSSFSSPSHFSKRSFVNLVCDPRDSFAPIPSCSSSLILNSSNSLKSSGPLPICCSSLKRKSDEIDDESINDLDRNTAIHLSQEKVKNAILSKKRDILRLNTMQGLSGPHSTRSSSSSSITRVLNA